MVVGINSNVAAYSAQSNLTKANNAVTASVAKLSSGNRIIKASDDAAGLAIGTSLKSAVQILQTAQLNASQANSVLQIADGALANIGDILARQLALAVQANTGSLDETSRGYLNQEFSSLTDEINRIVTSTTFNGITLLNGTLGSSTSGLDALATTVTFGSGSTSTVTNGTALYSGSIGTTAINSAPALAISGDNGNAQFQGSLSDLIITAETFGANNAATFQLQFGGQTYRSNAVDLSAANTARTVTFTNIADSGATFAFSLKTYSVPTNTADLNTIATNIQTDLRGISIFQSRTIATTTGNITSTTLNGTVLEGLDGGDFQVVGTGFDITNNTAPVFGPFVVIAETANTDGQVSTTLNGVNYSTIENQIDSTDAGDLQAGSLGGGTGILRLYKDGDSTTNPNDYIDIDLTNGGTPVIDNLQLDSSGSAQLLQDALNTAFGNGSAGALSFQVGALATDSISISIDSVKTADIYIDDSDVSQTLDISTQEGAQTAIDVLNNAISTVVGIRADVGASQSRFGFASANLDSAIANTDAARGSFLDADVASESTNFATQQVKLQASIAVLAQANQLVAALLKLVQ